MENPVILLVLAQTAKFLVIWLPVFPPLEQKQTICCVASDAKMTLLC